MSITKRQEQVLAKLWQFEQEAHVSPSVAEVKQIMGVKSNQSVIDMLARLKRSHWINRETGKARSLSLTTKTREYLIKVGASQILHYHHYHPIVVDHNTKMIAAEKVDTTQADSRKSLGNVSISYTAEKNPPIPQQLSLFNHKLGEIESNATRNNKFNHSFNSMAVQWVGHILDSTSTSAVSYATEFISGIFQSGLLYFIALKKFTGFSFPEIIVIVTFCLISVRLLKSSWKEKYVSSH